jgi:hypothetical protein
VTGSPTDDLADLGQRLSRIWPPAPGFEWINERGNRVTTVCFPTTPVRPAWMSGYVLDPVLSRPAILRWLHDRALEDPVAADVYSLLVVSGRHQAAPGLRNPRTVALAALAVLEAGSGRFEDGR